MNNKKYLVTFTSVLGDIDEVIAKAPCPLCFLPSAWDYLEDFVDELELFDKLKISETLKQGHYVDIDQIACFSVTEYDYVLHDKIDQYDIIYNHAIDGKDNTFIEGFAK